MKSAILRAAVKRCYSLQVAKRQKTIPDLLQKYDAKSPISMITAYDYITATWAQNAGTDIILVGDSLAMSTLGHESTTDLEFEEFRYHLKSVCKAEGSAFIVSDVPYGSFESSIEKGIQAVIDIMKTSSRIGAVKLEVGSHEDDYGLELAKEICRRGIPLVGHVGLTPQRVHNMGGFKVQGSKSVKQALAVYQRAKDLQDAGCFSLVLECVPHQIAKVITEKLSIPTIGIGAGPGTSGQVLVVSDVLGMLPGRIPKFVNAYSNMNEIALSAIEKYINEMNTSTFPKIGDHTFSVKDELLEKFLKGIK
ncbi:3-methyl-2-oxobutanoate hydroxymethyltransferase Ecym_7075 [Eremothecium cymbalariae DBVPG|uniref:3-methyl-2-oxobutanoate hydroxymethyltransferase n=1 Tax=Eremothecium cymbalariae (strain CBS 270.75 / DBVPG 7215 / KCTC 17166 / NRRL Y-17582) TaxID=931890 RepID=G8JVR3_ERECY|nr:hypothetical protein Ecym_7075 [Eremothecium cymbalariae DBVPG\